MRLGQPSLRWAVRRIGIGGGLVSHSLEDYLASEHGRVNVNRGSASELSAVLGLTAQQASAIVNHRRERGKYENFEAFAQTPGLDAAKLEKLREAISY